MAAGGNLTYTISVTNSGTLAATGVTLSDQLPSTVTEISASVSQGSIPQTNQTGIVTADLGTLGVGSTATITIVVATTVNSVGTITDSASASSVQTGSTGSQADATITATVLAVSDLSVALTASPSPVVAGDDLTDTFTISNLGPDTAEDVTATLPLATGVTFVSSVGGSATVTSSDGQVTASLASMAANTQTTVTVVVEPTVPGQLTQTVTVTSVGIDDNLANNVSTVSTQVIPNLEVGIAASAAVANPNVDFGYSVTATNNGPSDASDVVLTDTLPAGVTFVSASSTQSGVPDYSAGVVSLTIESLGSGASVTLTIVVVPTAAPGSTLTDSASVVSQQAGVAQIAQIATLTTPVLGVSDLGIAVSPASGVVYVGQDVTYTLTVSNQGPDDEPDAIVTCPLSSDVDFVSASYLPGWAPSVASGVLTADLGPLAAGATANLTVVFVPQAAAVGSLTTTFTIAGQNTDPVTTNNTAQSTLTVSPAADLQVTVSPGAAGPAVQDDWTYTVTVANLGLSDATGVVMTAPIPSRRSIRFRGLESGFD